MADTELEMTDIPGYKVILKAVIKNQIQQLVEQLALHTDEESIVLTASVADGSLSHLGSKSGKGFLDNDEDIKSQFMGYCLKNKLMSQNNQETGCGQIHPNITEHVTSSLKPLSPEKHGYSTNCYTRSSRIRHKPYSDGRTSDRKSLNVEQRNAPILSRSLIHCDEDNSLSEVEDAVCGDYIEIKVERLDNFEDACAFKETPKAQNDEMFDNSYFVKEISEIKSKDKDPETFQNEAEELISNINPLPFSETSSRKTTNCPQGIVSASCLANLACQSNDKSQIKSGSDVEMIQEVDDTAVKVEEISESDLEVEITDAKSLEAQAKQKTNHSIDMTLDPQIANSARKGGTIVLTPGDGTTQQSHTGQILAINMNNQRALPEAQHEKESVKYMKANRFDSHSNNDVSKEKSSNVKAGKEVGIGIRKTVNHVKKHTERSNRQAADIFRQFLSEKGEDFNFEVMKKTKLAKLLSDFYINVRTKDGQLYKLKSITQIRLSLNRYLRCPPFSRKLDIIHGYEFEDANKSYKAAVEKIKASGKGVTRHHPEITEKDLILLYSSNELNPSTPNGLQNRVQMTLRLTFNHESMDGMELMKKDTFKFAVDLDGTEYIYKSVTSSTVSSSESPFECSVKLKEMKASPCLCPVKAFKKYLSKLNPKCDRLWQYPRLISIGNESVWYQTRPLGKHSIARFMSELSKAVPLSRIYTNHSIRKTGKSIFVGDRRCLEEIKTLANMKKEN